MKTVKTAGEENLSLSCLVLPINTHAKEKLKIQTTASSIDIKASPKEPLCCIQRDAWKPTAGGFSLVSLFSHLLLDNVQKQFLLRSQRGNILQPL